MRHKLQQRMWPAVRSGHGLAMAAALLWSVNFALIKVAREQAGLGTVALTSGRFMVAGLCIVAMWMFWRRPRWGSFGWRGWAVAILMGIATGPVYQMLQSYAAIGVSAGLLGLIIATQSLHVTWVAKVVLGERFGKRQAAAMTIGFVGVAMPILFTGSIAYKELIYPLLIAVCAMVGSLNTVLPRMMHRHIESFDLATVVLGIAAGMCVPLLLMRGPMHEFAHLSFRGWVAVLWLGSAGHIGAFLLWYTALRKLSAVSTGFYLFVMMVASVFWGWAILGEPMSWTYGAASVAVLVGLWLNSGKTRRSEQVIIASHEG